MDFPWNAPPKKPQAPRDIFLERLRQGVPPDLACRAYGVKWDDVKNEPDVDAAAAEGEIFLFERARDSGVTGIVRSAMRYESKTWQPKPDGSAGSGQSLEDLLQD